jgi:hypothetical protein
MAASELAFSLPSLVELPDVDAGLAHAPRARVAAAASEMSPTREVERFTGGPLLWG